MRDVLEFAGEPFTDSVIHTCAYCGASTREVALVQILGRTGKPRCYTVCAKCNERIRRGLDTGERRKREERERKAEERRLAKGGAPR